MIADEILMRINRYGMGSWMSASFASLKIRLPDASLAPGTDYSTERSSGLVITLGRVLLRDPDPRESLVLARLEGDASAVPPRNLDPTRETISSAVAKLSRSTAGGSPSEIAAGDRRIAFFLDGGRIIELRFTSSMIGFDRFVIARLGIALDWRNSANR